ncbi:hypothetical protein DZF91_25250 [Actinomadura logoneensis]|uniref:Uncharacterized protein n=1 Tax=Actinomadura logoneensis TaxID=2293572 RepID=A0A372JG10_9ACTN|nr:hypothetical protein [Actinomadura logoneensis]RFU38900.1 hypothetical protein DZF91_25250 [Actinomadura logoneensis]
MNGRGVYRGAALTLLLGTLLAGLFLMHGMAASPSPIHFADPVPVAAPGTSHHLADATSGMTVERPSGMAADDMTTVRHMAGGAPARVVSAVCSGLGHDMGGCLGGTVCLALLVFGVLAAALVGRSVALLPARLPSAVRWTRRRGPPPARPPDLHRLCVLRL